MSSGVPICVQERPHSDTWQLGWNIYKYNLIHWLMNYLLSHYEFLRRWPTPPALSSAGTQRGDRGLTLRPHGGWRFRTLTERKSPVPVPTCRKTQCGICSRLRRIIWRERNILGCRSARKGKEIKNLFVCYDSVSIWSRGWVRCVFTGVWINNSSHERTLVIKLSMPWGLQPKPETRLRPVWPSRQLAGSLTWVCFQPPSHRGMGQLMTPAQAWRQNQTWFSSLSP